VKLPRNLSRRRETGNILLAVAVIVVAAVVVGYTGWKIYQALSKLGTSVSRQKQIEDGTEEGKSNIVYQVHQDFPEANVSVQWLSTNLVTSLTPFDPATVAVTIERSTNLVDWEVMARLQPGEVWSDTNAPWPAGFYRSRSQ